MKETTINQWFTMSLVCSLLLTHLGMLYAMQYMGCRFLWNGVTLDTFYRAAFGVHGAMLVGVCMGCSLGKREDVRDRIICGLLWSLCVSIVLWSGAWYRQYTNHALSDFRSSFHADLDPFMHGSLLLGDHWTSLEFFLVENSEDEEWIRRFFLPAVTNSSPRKFNIRFSSKWDYSEFSRWRLIHPDQSNQENRDTWLRVDHGYYTFRSRKEMEEALSEDSAKHLYLFPHKQWKNVR